MPTPRSPSASWTACFPDSRLTAEANLLIMPNLDAANITFNALKIVAGQGVTVGPILLGAAKPVHILTPTSTVRRHGQHDRAHRRRRPASDAIGLTASADGGLRHGKRDPDDRGSGEPPQGPGTSISTSRCCCAIVLGVLLGHFYPIGRRADEAARRRLHQADQDADRADHLLHRRARHRQHGGHEEGRPGRPQGAALLRGR